MIIHYQLVYVLTEVFESTKSPRYHFGWLTV